MTSPHPWPAIRCLAPVLLICAGAAFSVTAAGAADVEALCRRALTLKRSGELDASASLYRRAIEADPSYDEAHWGLAWVYRKQGLHNPAVVEFALVLELTTDEERALEAREALERLGVPVHEAKPVPSEPPPPPRRPQEISLAAAGRLLREGEAFEATRVFRALIADDTDRAEAERLLQEVKGRRRRVRVRAAADPVFRSIESWEERLRSRLLFAAAQISRQAPIDFELVSVEPWQRREPSTDGLDLIDELQADVPATSADIVVAFIAERREAPPVGDRLEIKGYTLGLAPCFTGYMVVSEVIASRDDQEWRVPEDKLRENLTHELGHLFGAVHVSGRTVMRPEPGGPLTFDFDRLNLEVMRACRWVDFREHFGSLSRDELERLADAYQAIADGPGVDDGVHFYRAVALTLLGDHEAGSDNEETAVARYAEAAREYELVLAASPYDIYTHYNLANVCEKLGRTMEARAHWKIATVLGKPPYVAQWAQHALDGADATPRG